VSGGTQTLIAAALVIFTWICCQTETNAFMESTRLVFCKQAHSLTDMKKEQTMIEKVVAKCLNMTKLWTTWRM